MISQILPILVMLGMGMCFRRCSFVSVETVEGMKKIITKVILPVAIFNALGTAEYTAASWIMIGIMLIAIVATFLLGFLVKKLVREPYSQYVPYFVSVYEGGMIAYPLFLNLCGNDQLSKIAILDVACLLFGFSIYMGMLEQQERGEPFRFSKFIKSAVRNPAFAATVLGILGGTSGILGYLSASQAGQAYHSVVSVITAPLTSMVLITVGYNMSVNHDSLLPCLQAIGLRIVVQFIAMIPTAFAAHLLFGGDRSMVLAVIMLMFSPATFSIQAFLKSRQGSEYIATANSIYTLVTIGVYIVLTVV